MTNEEIIQLARDYALDPFANNLKFDREYLVRFARKIEDATKEKCAKLAEAGGYARRSVEEYEVEGA